MARRAALAVTCNARRLRGVAAEQPLTAEGTSARDAEQQQQRQPTTLLAALDKLWKQVRAPMLAAVLGVALAFSSVDAASAASRSGGRVGGSTFRRCAPTHPPLYYTAPSP